ncbi:hypothetical protein MNV49_004497 [Pseudohyphozyma bogoriensis]|nr:hypothetical protein MNV49_004497 [Pseudohyphozyma bogoriensis]
MATIQSCPPEILFNIIESSLPSHYWLTDQEWDEERRAQLRSTALVARDWRGPSQMLLWTEITMKNDKYGDRGDWVVDKFVAGTTPGLYRTARLHLKRVSPDKAAALLSHLRGIEYLKVDKCETPTSLFLSPALSGLRELNIDSGQPNGEHAPTHLSIRLNKLVLDSEDWIKPLVASLVASSRHSLTHLEFHLTKYSAEVLDILQVVMPNVQTLRMPGFFEADPAPLTHFFNSCGSLDHLTLHADPSVLDPLNSLAQLVTGTEILRGGTLRVVPSRRHWHTARVQFLFGVEELCRKNGIVVMAE